MSLWIKIAEGDQTSWMARLISCVHLNFLSDQVSWLIPGAKWAPGSDLNPSWKGKYTGTQRKKIRAKITSWLQAWDITSITGFNSWYHIFCQFLPVCIIIFLRDTLKRVYLLISSVAQSCLTLCNPMDCSTPTSLSITNSQSLLKFVSIESMMPSNHLILCRPLLLPPSIFPASGSFPVSQFFASGGQSFGASASASVLPMNIQD